MKIIVMGGGVIGVTTAYWLAKSGHEVQVLERNSGVGEETSFQNGALLAPGHSQSWAAPGAFWTLAKSLFQQDPALQVPLQQRSAVLALGNEVPGQLHTAKLSRQYATRPALHDGGPRRAQSAQRRDGC